MVKSFNWYIWAAVCWLRTTRGILGKVWELMDILEILLLIDPFSGRLHLLEYALVGME
jgi:hypothetical protein